MMMIIGLLLIYTGAIDFFEDDTKSLIAFVGGIVLLIATAFTC